ncbi:MAG: hypothetical protein ABEJ74_01710 [Haloferacaceae archaeon]
MPHCERCSDQLKAKSNGLLDRLGLKGYESWECKRCGSLLCNACFRQRRRELAGSPHDTCPVCGGLLEHR